MLFSPDTSLQKLQLELETALFDANISYGAIANLYKKFCNFFHGCDKVKLDHVKSLAHCCLKYIECIQNHIDKTTLRGKFHSEALKDLLAVVGDISKLEGVKDAYLLCITIPIFEKITEPDIKVWFSKILLKNFNLAVQGTRKQVRHTIVDKHPLYLCRMADIICTCGDYDYQVMLLEAIFRMCSETHINQYAHEMFPSSVEFKNGFCSISKDNFDMDARTFLNMVNSNLKKVLSLKCEIVQLGNMKIAAPKDSEQNELPIWADFNLGTKTIGIFCDRDSLRTSPSLVDSENEDFELITVNVADINNVLMSSIFVPDSPYSVGFIILFNMTGPCSVMYHSSAEAAKATELKLAIYNCPELTEVIEKLLPNWFGENIKNMTPPKGALERNQKDESELRFPIAVSKALEIDALSSDGKDTSRGSLASVLLNFADSSQEDPEICELRQKNTAAPAMGIATKKVYKPLATEDAPVQSRSASGLSNKSSISDALSLKDKLHAHQAQKFVRTEKFRISKSPNILNIEQLKEVTADPELTLLAKRQEENRILAKKGKVLTEPEAADNVIDISDDVILVEDDNTKQTSPVNVNPKRYSTVAQKKEIIKVKWPWPKKVSVSAPASFPKMSVTVNPVFEEECSNNSEKTTNTKVVKGNQVAEKQLTDTSTDLPKLENIEITKQESSKLKKKSKTKKTSKKIKDLKTKQKKETKLRKSVRLEYQAIPKETETIGNTESTHSEQVSTLNVLISGDLCGNTEQSSSIKNTEETIFSSLSPSSNHFGKLVEDTCNVKVNTDNVIVEHQKTVKNCKNQVDENSIKTHQTQTQAINLTISESDELENTIQAQSEKIFNTESEDPFEFKHSDSKRDTQVETEKESSCDIVESSQQEQIVKFHKPEIKIVDQISKPKKPGRAAKKQSKLYERKTRKTTNAESSTNKSSDDNIKNDRGAVLKDHHEKKTTDDTIQAETTNKEKHQQEMEKKILKDESRVKANKIQPLNEEIDEDRSSDSEANKGVQKSQIEIEAIFDELLEEFKTSQKHNIATMKTNESSLKKSEEFKVSQKHNIAMIKTNESLLNKSEEFKTSQKHNIVMIKTSETSLKKSLDKETPAIKMSVTTQKQTRNDEDMVTTTNRTNILNEEDCVKELSKEPEQNINEDLDLEVPPTTNEPTDDHHSKISAHHMKPTNDEEINFKTCYVILKPLNNEKSLKKDQNKIEKNDKDRFKTPYGIMSKPLNDKEDENKIGNPSTNGVDNHTETNEIQRLLNEEIEKNKSEANEVKGSSDVEALFDNLLEEYKTNQKSHILENKNEVPLNMKSSETPTSEDILTIKMNQDETRNQTKNRNKSSVNIIEKMKETLKVAPSSKKGTKSRKISQKKQTKDKSKEENPLEEDLSSKPNREGITTDGPDPKTCKIVEEVPKQISSQEDFQEPKLTRKNRITQTKPKNKIEELSTKEHINKHLQKQTIEKNQFHNVEETSSQEFFEKLELVKTNLITRKKYKSEMKSNKETSQRDGPSNEEILEKEETVDEDFFKPCDIVEEIPKYVSSQEFFENVEKSIVLQNKQKRKTETNKKTSQKNVSIRKGRKCRKKSTKNEKTAVLNFQGFDEQLQEGKVQDEIITTIEIEAIQSKTNITKTNEDQFEPQSTAESNLTPAKKQKRLRLPDSSDDEEVQNKKNTLSVKKTNEDQLPSTVLNKSVPQSPAEENLTLANETKILPLPDSSDGEEVQYKKPTRYIKNTNEDQAPSTVLNKSIPQSPAEENQTSVNKPNILPLPDSSDDEEVQNKETTLYVEKTNADQLPNVVLKDKQQTFHNLPKSLVGEQLAGKEIEENDISTLKTAWEVQDKKMDSKTNEDQLANTVFDDKQQTLKSLSKSLVVEQVPDKKLEENDIIALEGQDKNMPEKRNEDQAQNTIDNDRQQKLLTSPIGGLVLEQFRNEELQENVISAIEITQLKTNEDQSLQQHTESSVAQKLSPLPDSSINEQLQEQSKKFDNNIVEVSDFDQLLVQGNTFENRKRKISPDNIYDETPKKRQLAEPNHAEETIKTIDKASKIKKVQRRPRKLYNLNDASYFENVEDGLNIREQSHLVDESPCKRMQEIQKTNETSDVAIVEDSLIYNKPTKETLIERNQNSKEISTNLDKVVNQDQDYNKTKFSSKKINKDQDNNNINVTSTKCHTDFKHPTDITPTRQNLNSNKTNTKYHKDFKHPAEITPINQNLNSSKINTTSTKCHKDFKQPKITPTPQNKLEKLVIQKITKTQTELPKRKPNKRSNKKEEKENSKRQRTSGEPEKSTRRNPFESVTYTGAHLNSPKQLEKIFQFDLLMQSFDATLKEYSTVINDPIRRKSYKTTSGTGGKKKKNDECKYKKLSTQQKQKTQSKQMKDKENQNIFRYYKHLLTQMSSPLPDLDVEVEAMEESVIELSDSEDEANEALELNAAPKISSKTTENVPDGVNLICKDKFVGEANFPARVTVEDRNKAKENTPPPPIPTKGADDEYYPVSPMNALGKSVQVPNNIENWVEGATIFQEIRKLSGKVSNIELVVLNIQNMLRAKNTNAN